ncbi:uncharacterized protein MKZ38_010703 [Zalerion maritima]|uniref:Zn(2)-C6 fungal-type domain-containing protein n=1 Tax=Zalerion maritima TaxID=339359 RepID=A0AAD5RTM8_9PEZI|nr:uncharacterized protein MKZ38_010703 [Zalerion maritima]
MPNAMAPDSSASSQLHARQQHRRRKISLACEPCRDRKTRCDGLKPICSSCERRSLGLERCIYKVDNGRTASNDEYIKALHERIRNLEQVCVRNGIHVSDIGTPPAAAASLGRVPPPESPAAGPGVAFRNAGGGLKPGATTTGPHHPPSDAGSASKPPAARAASIVYHSPAASEDSAAAAPANSHGVTAMGTLGAEDHRDDDNAFTAEDFYGSSSTASFVKEACASIKLQSPTASPGDAGLAGLAGASMSIGGDSATPRVLPIGCGVPGALPAAAIGGSERLTMYSRFVLPPRALADHLMEKFYQNIFPLYPLFHRPAFNQAYERLWDNYGGAGARNSRGSQDAAWNENQSKPPLVSLGLGSPPDADTDSIVFHTGLNCVFALGCHYADLPQQERLAMAHSFFMRGKNFVGLDMLDKNNIGVVQSLLLMALVLQSTPYTSRCWHAVGVACRVAIGLGLHLSGVPGHTDNSLQSRVRRRTWYGCVILDTVVSMTFGRPTITSHLSMPRHIPLASELEDDDTSPNPRHPPTDHNSVSLMSFFAEIIRLVRILDEILAKVYHPWLGTSVSNMIGTEFSGPLPDQPGVVRPAGGNHRSCNFDIIIDLHARLSDFEMTVSPSLSWVALSEGEERKEKSPVLALQKRVLYSLFVYLQVMLYRPILTRFLSGDISRGGSVSSSSNTGASHTVYTDNILYSQFAAQCAKSCVESSVRLIESIHQIYKLSAEPDFWWWDGLYASTAGLVLVVCRLHSSLWETLDQERVHVAWEQCQEVLGHLASFSMSARNSLALLQKIHDSVTSNKGDPAAAAAARGNNGDSASNQQYLPSGEKAPNCQQHNANQEQHQQQQQQHEFYQHALQQNERVGVSGGGPMAFSPEMDPTGGVGGGPIQGFDMPPEGMVLGDVDITETFFSNWDQSLEFLSSGLGFGEEMCNIAGGFQR